MKSVLIISILSILMSLAPTIEHATDSSPAVEILAKQSVDAHASMSHEKADDDCCHDNCICCFSSSSAMPAIFEVEKTTISFVINFDIPKTTSPHLEIYLRPPILS